LIDKTGNRIFWKADDHLEKDKRILGEKYREGGRCTARSRLGRGGREREETSLARLRKKGEERLLDPSERTVRKTVKRFAEGRSKHFQVRGTSERGGDTLSNTEGGLKRIFGGRFRTVKCRVISD